MGVSENAAKIRPSKQGHSEIFSIKIKIAYKKA
jgi:hypothetical protein